MSEINAAIVVSDIHCGSSVGLAAPETILEEGNIVTHGNNHHQAWLWDCWMNLFDQAKDILCGTTPARVAGILNGDAIEGIHHGSTEVMAAQKEIHLDMAEAALRPLCELADEVFITRGTECHTNGLENVLAERIGAYSGEAYKKLLIRIHGCLLDVTHHVNVTSRKNLEASGMGINLANAQLNYLRANTEAPRVFLRGHRHTGGWYSDGHSAMGVTGGWQFLTRHGYKVVPDSIPTPYALILDWRNLPECSLPRVHELRFNPPAHKIVEI